MNWMKKYMKKTALFLLLLPVFAFAQTNKDSILNVKINAIEKQFNELEKEIDKGFDEFNDKLLFQQKISEQTLNISEKAFNNISTQIDASKYWMAIFTVIFTIISALIGWYVTTSSRKVAQSKKDADDIKQDVEGMVKIISKAQETVERIQEDINNKIPEIYTQIKREETISLLNRLVEFPEDINYISPLLLTKKLQKGDFMKLKEACLNLGSPTNNDYTIDGNRIIDKYFVLFFQQFLVISIKDDLINQGISGIFQNGLAYCSKKNIAESTSDFVELLSQEGLIEFKKELGYYFTALSLSRQIDNNRIYEIFFENLKSRELQFELFDAIKLNFDQRFSSEKKEILIKYGNLLFTHYENDNLSEQEQKIFEEFNALKNGNLIQE
jgi:hypothetical protein